jgi:hypothetical protein
MLLCCVVLCCVVLCCVVLCCVGICCDDDLFVIILSILYILLFFLLEYVRLRTEFVSRAPIGWTEELDGRV